MIKSTFPNVRLRRLRYNPLVRGLVMETQLHLNDLVCPVFVKGTTGEKNPISSMPGYYQIPLDKLEKEVNEIANLGLTSIILFGVPPHKDAYGTDSYSDDGIIQQAVCLIKRACPNLLVITDTCFCEYTDHGHCGIVSNKTGKADVDNDKTIELLVRQAVSQAQSGADVIAPSGMIDGMVAAIRQGLDRAGFEYIPILSYSVKYSSALYGPFRYAAEGSPQFGDRSTHQMDCANGSEALREALLDVEEGADMLMVKPALSYLDVICRIKQQFPYMPLGAYHVSGEYSMLKAAAERGWIDERKATLEILQSIRRAGADFIISYCAKNAAEWKLF